MRNEQARQNFDGDYRSINKKRQNATVFILYSLLVSLIYILPYTKFTVPYIVAALLMLISMPSLIGKDKEVLEFSLGLLCVSVFYFCRYAFLSEYALSDAINECIRNIRFFLPVLWGSYALRACDRKQLKGFLIVFSIVIGFITVKTLGELATDPMLARILAQGSESSTAEINAYRLANIGGFEFSYMMGIVALCFMWLFLVRNEIWVKTISLIAYIIVFYYIIESQYTILLFLTFVGSVLLLFCCKKNPMFRLILIIISLVLIFSLASIFEYLSKVFEKNDMLALKFERLAESITSNDASALGSRPKLLKNSLKNWWKSPIIGGYYGNSNAHSMIMDILESTGLVGFSLWCYLVAKAYKCVKQSLKEYSKGMSLFNCATVYVILLALFNPIGYIFEITIALYFLLPVFVKFCTQEEQRGGSDA